MYRYFSSADIRLKTLLILALILACILFAYWSDYNLATGSGNLCMVLFIAAQSYIPAKYLRLFFMLKDDAFFATFLRVHCWINIILFVAACLHCYVTHWHNTYLWVALILMGWLTFGGVVLRFKYLMDGLHPVVGKGLYFLHTQMVVFFIMCLCLLKGHYVF
ncbi:MAG: hypothetical protein HQM15_08405 [Deltaproteobacteria bacterium]|nr:hypothetical protein [Deltaproteobacteria bacterium]